MFYTEGIDHDLHPEHEHDQRFINVWAAGMTFQVDRQDREIEINQEAGDMHYNYVMIDTWNTITKFFNWLFEIYTGE